jgi:hypothetical protein
MDESRHNPPSTWLVEPPCGGNEAFAELTLLVPHSPLESLEWAASWRGISMAQLLRSLIRDRHAGLDGRGDFEMESAQPKSVPGEFHGRIWSANEKNSLVLIRRSKETSC